MMFDASRIVEPLFTRVLVVLIISVPLAVWKIIDIAIWLLGKYL